MPGPEEREMQARERLTETLQCDHAVNQIMIGNCPKCGSSNVHNCEAQTPIMEKSVMNESFLKILGTEPYHQYGSNCPVAKEIDNNNPGVGIGVGHCDDCNYLWCLDCGSELSVEDSNCGHWCVCNNCPEIDPNDDCPECSYSGLESTCPRILTWKKAKK